MVDAARVVGSRVVCCVLGSAADRTGAIPIEGHIENTVKCCATCGRAWWTRG
jgi:hypothetical protein